MTSEYQQEIQNENYHNGLNLATKGKDAETRGAGTKKQGILAAAYALHETGEVPDKYISTQIRQDLSKEPHNWSKGQLDYVTELLKDEDFTNPNLSRVNPTNDNQITDEQFDELSNSVFDRTEELAEKELSIKQLDKLSDAEAEQVLKQDNSVRKARKTIDNDIIKRNQEYAQKRGLHIEPDKVTKERPPSKYWEVTEASNLCFEARDYHYNLGDQFNDLGNQLVQFPPTIETKEKAIPEFLRYLREELIPYTKVFNGILKGTKGILRNITDEKYTKTKSGWMKEAADKFLRYGNHGSGEVNAVLTGIYIMKLGKHEIKDEDGNVIKTIDCVIRTPVEREDTREQVGDKCVFEIDSQQFITCPNCTFEFNKPAINDEERDLIAGDMFEEQKEILLKDGLSNFIDHVATNVITEEIKTPEQFFKEAMKKKYNIEVTDEELKKLIVIENTPEKIKAINIDPESINRIDHSILHNGARRKLNKAEDFSRVA